MYYALVSIKWRNRTRDISHYQAMYEDQVSTVKNLQKGGVCIFVCKDPHLSKIYISCNCKEKIWKFLPLNYRLNQLN
jgi:beta-galactosidase beta subunit